MIVGAYVQRRCASVGRFNVRSFVLGDCPASFPSLQRTQKISLQLCTNIFKVCPIPTAVLAPQYQALSQSSSSSFNPLSARINAVSSSIFLLNLSTFSSNRPSLSLELSTNTLPLSPASPFAPRALTSSFGSKPSPSRNAPYSSEEILTLRLERNGRTRRVCDGEVWFWGPAIDVWWIGRLEKRGELFRELCTRSKT